MACFALPPRVVLCFLWWCVGRVIYITRVPPLSFLTQHGVDKVLNSVHVTDLAEDGQLEVEYFFNLLAKTAS